MKNLGATRLPDRTLLMGVIGIGKSTWAANANKPAFMDVEKRLSHVRDIHGAPVMGEEVNSWEDAMKFIQEFPADQYKTCVVDTVDELESFAHKFLCARDKVASIVEVGGGYGKGFDQTVELFRRMLLECDKLRAKGVEIVLNAHSQSKIFTNPAGPDYARFIPRMNEKLASMICAWADNVFFCCHRDELVVKKGEKQGVMAKGKAIGNDESRVMKCTRVPAWEAKNHYDLPEELPLMYSEFAKARQEWIDKQGKLIPKLAPAPAQAVESVKQPAPTGLAALAESALSELIKRTGSVPFTEKLTASKIKAKFYPEFASFRDALAAGKGSDIFNGISQIYSSSGIALTDTPALAAVLKAL